MMRALAAGLVAVFVVACSGAGGPSPALTSPPDTQPPVTASAEPTAQPSATPGAESPMPPASPSADPTSTVAPATPPPSVEPTPEDSLDWSELTTAAAGPSAREDHTWTVDGDGAAAYLFGGRGDGGASNELWSYDLAADTWTQLNPAGAAPAPRFGHTATWVPGTGLVVWSGQRGSDFFADIWAYDPAANSWTELPSGGEVPAARYGSCASLGPDGRLWVSHGFTDSGRFFDTRAYDFATGQWTDETPDGDVPVERCLHDCWWSADGSLILYGGQTNGVAALGDLWAFDPQSSSWSRGPEPDAPARQLYARATGEGIALVFGGGSADGGFLDDTWLIADETLEFVEQPFQTRPPARSGATLIPAGDFRYLLFGGRNQDGPMSDLWELSGFFSQQP